MRMRSLVFVLAVCALLVSSTDVHAQANTPVAPESPPAPEPAPQSWLDRTWLPARPPQYFEAVVGASAYPLARSFTLDLDATPGRSLAVGLHGTLTHCDACNIAADAEDRPHEVGLGYAYLGYEGSNYMVAGAFALTRGEGLESRANRFGYGPMFLLRIGHIDGLRLGLGVGIDVVFSHPNSGGLILHSALDVPLFRSGSVQLDLEARSDFTIPDPFFWIPSLGVRMRTGPVVFGVRAQLFAHANSLMLLLGYHRE